MLRGKFRRFCHDHYFEVRKSGTAMTDKMEFEAPFGLLGRLAEVFVLGQHMKDLLMRRNRHIKQVAEATEEWKKYLPS